MKATIFDYYNRNHREVLILFLLLSFVFLLIPYLYHPKIKRIDPQKISEFNALVLYKDSLNNRWKNLPIQINTITKDSLIEIGIDAWLAKSIERYRGFGKVIRKYDDLLKIYGMQDSIASQLNIDYSIAPIKDKKDSRNKRKIKLVDIPKYLSTEIRINEITQDSLIALGLPRKLSGTIIKYREASKGFKNEEDLREVYGMKEKLFSKLNIYYDMNRPESKSSNKMQPKVKPKWATHEIDINNISKDSLTALGFPVKLSGTIIKFRNSIKGYKNHEDLQKIFGLSDYYLDQMKVRFSEFKDSIAILDTLSIKSNQKILKDTSNFKKYKNFKPVEILDINTVTKGQLIAIYNIGEASADRILNYREALGGFYSIDQVEKTSRLHPLGFLAIKENTEVRTSPRKIDLSTPNADELSKHPYLSKRQAQRLIKWLKLHTDYSKDDLKSSGLFSDLEWDRIEHYL